MTEELSFDIVVIGAGVLGLACAHRLLETCPKLKLLVVERHAKFGWETSSHNSEVIHAGLYYEGLPEKQKHCLRGRDLLYSYCRKHQIPFRQCGKLLLAFEESQIPALEKIHSVANALGIPLERKPLATIQQQLANPNIQAALWSPQTGIIDSHAFMKSLETSIFSQEGLIIYAHTVSAVTSRENGFSLEVMDPQGTPLNISTRFIINAAGLASARVAQLFEESTAWQIRPCLGRYFRLSSKWSSTQGALLYPLPDPRGGLGIHLTYDLAGQARLGPDVLWSSEKADNPRLYRFPESPQELRELTEKFLLAGQHLLPGLELGDLSVDYIGVRPKLFQGEIPHKDFYLGRGKSGRDWHLLGIESPGLTAALSIAEEVSTSLAF